MITTDQRLIQSMLNDLYNMILTQKKNVTIGEEYYDTAISFLDLARKQYEIYCQLQK